MKTSYKKLIPQWSHFNDEIKYDLILSNDLDSLITCKILEQEFGFKIGYFYDFNNLWKLENISGDNVKLGIDIALTTGKTIDNHVSSIHQFDEFNSDSLNINNIEKIHGTSDKYFHKYAGSTLLTALSVYNISIPDDEELQMIILSIDSTFQGYYSNYPRDNAANKKYLIEVLEFEELYELQKRKKVTDFYNIINKYNLKSNICMNNQGYLKCNQNLFNLQVKLWDKMGINLNLPNSKFTNIESFYPINMDIPKDAIFEEYTKRRARECGNNIYSLAMTGKYNVSMSFN